MRPIKFLLAALLLLSFSVNAQTGKPSGYPVTNSTGWFKWGYAQADSGRIDANRDTMWKPSIIPTTVYWQGDFWTYTQTTGQRWNKKGGGTATDSAVVLKSVTQIASLSNAKVNSIFVTDTLRGGNFFRYSGTGATDNGMIFVDALGQKWLRQTNDDKVNILWYGVRQNGVDCRSQVMTALNYIYQNPRMTTLYFPYDSSVTAAANVYYLTDSLLIRRSVNILGDGYYKNPMSQLYFANHKSGLVFQFLLGESAIYNRVENIHLHCPGGKPYDLNRHGLKTNGQIYINNVYIEGFDGNGLHMSACSIEPSGNNNNYGSCNNSTVIDLKLGDITNGVFMEGCDVNKVKFYGLDVTGCRRWGVYDNGFLGNDYYSNHSGGNGTTPNEKTAVTYGGKYYAAIPGHDGYFQDATDSNYNKQPDINLGTYWEEVSAMATSGAWSSTTRYYSGGPFAVVGSSAWTTFYSPYTEGPNAPIWLNTRSNVLGGTPGANVVNGAWWNMFNGYQYLNNTYLVLPTGKVSIGTDPDASTVLHSLNKSGTPYSAMFEGYNTLVAIKLKNTTTTAEFDLNGTDLQWYDLSGLRMTLGTSSLTPGVNNTFDLGSSSLKWNNLYVNLTSGAGTKQVRWDGSKLTVLDTLHNVTFLSHQGNRLISSVTGDTIYIDGFTKVATTTSASTITPNCDTTNMYTVTALATNPTFAAPSGTPFDGQQLTIRIKDNGTSRSITWNGIYRDGTDVALPTATTISKVIYTVFLYNQADLKWDLVNVKNGF